MFPLVISIFEAILLGVALAILTGYAGMWFARRTGLMDVPGKLPHKQHTESVAIAGGLALFSALLVGFLVFRADLSEFTRLLLPVGIVFATGLVDDYRPLPYVVKLAGQFLAAGLLVVLGFQVTFLKPEILSLAPAILGALNLTITLLWLAGTSNAFNFVDSMDGLATGTASIIGTFLAVGSVFSGQLALARLMGLLVGICLVLYFLNLSPARLFLGDSGALTIGFLLAAGAMIFAPKGFSQASSWFVPVMVLGLPLFDMGLVIFSRLRRARPIYQADRGHTYHRLIRLGYAPNRAIALLHLVSVVLGCLAFVAMQFEPLAANIIFAMVLAAAFGAILYLDHPSRWS